MIQKTHCYISFASVREKCHCIYHWTNSYRPSICLLLSAVINLTCMDDFFPELLGLEGVVYSLTRNKWFKLSNWDNGPNGGMLTSINLHFTLPIPCPNCFDLLVIFYDSLFNNRNFQIRKRIIVCLFVLLSYIMKYRLYFTSHNQEDTFSNSST